jgi:IS5 family transposase
LFEEINRQLDVRGLIIRKGTLIDATIVQAAVKPPKGNAGEVSERDPEAGWTKKNGLLDAASGMKPPLGGRPTATSRRYSLSRLVRRPGQERARSAPWRRVVRRAS